MTNPTILCRTKAVAWIQWTTCCTERFITEKQRQRDSETERQRYRETEGQRDRETERQRDIETERQGDRETEGQRDRETERQRDRESGPATTKSLFISGFHHIISSRWIISFTYAKYYRIYLETHLSYSCFRKSVPDNISK